MDHKKSGQDPDPVGFDFYTAISFAFYTAISFACVPTGDADMLH